MNRRTRSSSDHHFNNNNNNPLHSSQQHHINDECDGDESTKTNHCHITTTTNTNTTNQLMTKIWELPDPILCYILCYIAVPTKRTYVICHQLAPLCKESYEYLLVTTTSTTGGNYRHTIWETILNEDYYNSSMYGKVAANNKNCSHQQQQQRSSKRLKQSSFEQIQNAHRIINERSEAAFIELCNIIRCSSSSYYDNLYNNNITNTSSIRKKKNNSVKKLSLTTLKSIFQHYGPYIHINHCMSSGGVYLIEICRARNVKELIIYKCFEWLIEIHHADINIISYESKNNQQTSLCVAAVRGMSTIVQYLLNHNVKTDVKCSGRFTLSSTIISSSTSTESTTATTNTKRHTGQKVLTCKDKTAYEFAIEMYNAEVNVGICTKLLDKTLGKCIKLLEPYHNVDAVSSKK